MMCSPLRRSADTRVSPTCEVEPSDYHVHQTLAHHRAKFRLLQGSEKPPSGEFSQEHRDAYQKSKIKTFL
jgi:hypothetical protein